jgi:hypothetical protein
MSNINDPSDKPPLNQRGHGENEMEHIDRHFVDRARRVVEAEMLRRDLHRIAMHVARMRAAGQRWRDQVEEGRVRSTPADPAG